MGLSKTRQYHEAFYTSKWYQKFFFRYSENRKAALFQGLTVSNIILEGVSHSSILKEIAYST